LQEGSVVVVGGYLLNASRYLLRAGERWAMIAGVLGRARWQKGALDDAATGGASLGLGYEIPGRLRIGIGARAEDKLDGGVSVSPEGHFRWDITDHWRLRDRALGLHLEYRPGGPLEYFIEAYRTSDSFLLDSETPSDLTFEDKRVITAIGAEWKVHHRLRLRGEAGAVVDRQLRYESDGDRLDTISGDPSAYIGLRVELRP
jgi:hypothetical protein